MRLDKGFFSKEMVALVTELDVTFLMKVPDHAWVRRTLTAYRPSEKDATLWTATGELYGARLASVERRTPVRVREDTEQPELALDAQEVTERVAHVLTNLEGAHALTVWRCYNAGAVIEQRIKECYQLGFGTTAVDDLAGNAILAGLGVVAYQMLHLLRTTALEGAWRRAQPATLRQWLFRLPARSTTHARKHDLHLLHEEPMRRPLLRALRHLAGLDPPRTRVLAL